MTQTLATRLALLRTEAGLSLQALAKILGVAVSTLSRLEKGEMSNPSMSITERICAFYGVNRDWLMEGFGEKFSAQDPRKTRNRFFELLAASMPKEGEAELREQKILTEVTVTLAQARHASDALWRRYLENLSQAIDDYRTFCREHTGAQEPARAQKMQRKGRELR
jgi:transcriptional regulator with XRE-family HTH domain